MLAQQESQLTELVCPLCCFQAVMLDSTDVNLWYKIGHVALRLIRVPLARHAFEEGLRCNPDHWPCLDNLITVLYTLSDYTSESGLMTLSHVLCFWGQRREGILGKLKTRLTLKGFLPNCWEGR